MEQHNVEVRYLTPGRLMLLLVILANIYEASPYSMQQSADCRRQLRLVDKARKCMKRCHSDNDCRGKNKQCLCDGFCGTSCINPTKKCENPTKPVNGQFEVTPFPKFNAVVRYTCDAGFILVGSSKRRCQGDGTWSGGPPTCETQGRCGEPPVVPNASHDGPPDRKYYPLRTQVQYTCWTGYQQDGFERAMCVDAGRWVGPRMKCSPRRCGYPGDISNGFREGQVYTYPNMVTYHCNTGFQLVGHRTRSCQADGLWSGSIPSCRAVQCPPISAPSNGVMHGQQGNYRYRAEVTFECNAGYILDGPLRRTCQQDGIWSGHQPYCQVVRCELPTDFYGGFIDHASTVYQSTIMFKCLNNMNKATLIGSEHARCQADGTWDNPVPHCLLSCKRPYIKNSTIKILKPYEDPSWTPHKAQVNVTCDQGFVLSNTSMPTCYNGTWPYLPKCRPAGCKHRPMSLHNGIVRFHSLRHGSRARYRCYTGFKMVGGPDLKCQFGQWTGIFPQCRRRLCRHVGPLENGDVLLVGFKGKYKYTQSIKTVLHNDPIEYQCDKNYKLEGPKGATCVNGSWSPPQMPICRPQKHLINYYSFRHGK